MLLGLNNFIRRTTQKFNICVTSCCFKHYDTSNLKECNIKVPCGETAGGVITGVYIQPGGGNFKFTKTGMALDDIVAGRLTTGLLQTQPFPVLGQVRIFHGLHPIYTSIAVVGLGEQCKGYSIREQIDEKKEAIRTAAANGILAMDDIDFTRILVDSLDHAESSAEGSSMAAWMYQEFKDLKRRKKTPRLELFNSCDFTGWQIGLHKAAAQNLTRHLQEAPANHLTPQAFAQSVIELLSKYNINVEVRMKHWAKLRNLNAFLAAGQGGCDPIFMEMTYEGCDPDICPVVLVGKGVTFNTGGLCRKSCKDMKHMRGDMIGAACIVATMRAIAALQLPVNVRALIPLCTNMIGARSVKPGDTVRAYNGKTIRIDCPNCEGLLMHADALSYAGEYDPKFILDIGSIAQDSYAAFGQAGTLVFSNNESLYETMRVASIHTGDRIWRFPLWNYFRDYMKVEVSDSRNRAPWMIGGGACKAAAFLREFIPPKSDWIHIDVQNVFRTNGVDFPYLREGMSGRPTRNIIEFLAQLACKPERKC